MSSRTARAPSSTLLAGLVVVTAAAIAPSGLGGKPIPAASWVIWGAAFGLALAWFAAAGVKLRDAARRMLWLLPLIALLAIPAGLLSPPGSRAIVTMGLAARSLAATSTAAALAAWLGAQGLVEGARRLGIPARFVAVLEASLAGMSIVVRQATAMLRAREARRPGYGAWSRLVASPRRTAIAFGRLVAALLLRSLERGESLERARRARGIGDP